MKKIWKKSWTLLVGMSVQSCQKEYEHSEKKRNKNKIPIRDINKIIGYIYLKQVKFITEIFAHTCPLQRCS